jgi:hypothetical protein
VVNQPEKDMQGTQPPVRGSALPTSPDGGFSWQRSFSPPTASPLHPSAPDTRSLLTRLLRLWRKEPVYAVLSLTIGLVALVSLLFVVLGTNALLSPNTAPAWSSSQIEHPPALTPVGTVDNHPTFPTPGSNKGSSSSSQPHGGPPPVLQPGPGGPDQGTLSVLISGIPSVVRNNTRVRVLVQTTEPGVSVRLQITYDAAPFFSASSARTTDGNGNTALTWNVRVFGFSTSGVQASVVAVATDSSGQQATSQSATVMITG